MQALCLALPGSICGAHPYPCAASVTTLPARILDSAVYWWDPTGKSYATADQIEEGKGYWIAATQACNLTVAPV